jgi:hypothetical protein
MCYNYSDSDSPVLAFVFFGCVVIFCAFFALNLVLAQIMVSWHKEKDLEDPVHEEMRTNLI